MNTFLLYGASGYTGQLIAREAVGRGLRPVLAGRTAAAVRAVAEPVQLDYRVFPLEEAATLDAALREVRLVLNCAGPFVRTAQPMVDGCLRTGTHYLDITGEIAVFEALAARTVEARDRGILLLPGVGFDVVPSDCLAAHLKQRLPSATHLALAFATSSRTSRGTATTALEKFPGGGMVRRNGVLQRVPSAWKTRRLDLGRGPVHAITIPWGDVATAWYSTDIPNIETYMAAPWSVRLAARLLRYLGWLVCSAPVQGFLKRRIQSGPPGPTDEERANGWSLLWGEATDDKGGRVVSRMRGPEGYTLTALTALAVVERVLGGQAPVGFQTPSLAFGPDLVLQVPGVVRTDE